MRGRDRARSPGTIAVALAPTEHDPAAGIGHRDAHIEFRHRGGATQRSANAITAADMASAGPCDGPARGTCQGRTPWRRARDFRRELDAGRGCASNRRIGPDTALARQGSPARPLGTHAVRGGDADPGDDRRGHGVTGRRCEHHRCLEAAEAAAAMAGTVSCALRSPRPPAARSPGPHCGSCSVSVSGGRDDPFLDDEHAGRDLYRARSRRANGRPSI